MMDGEAPLSEQALASLPQSLSSRGQGSGLQGSNASPYGGASASGLCRVGS